MNYQQTAFDFQIKNTKNVFDSVVKTCQDLASSGVFKTVISFNGKDMVLNNNIYHINSKMFAVLLKMLTDEGFSYKSKTKLFSRKKTVKLSWEPTDYVEYYNELQRGDDLGSVNAVHEHTDHDSMVAEHGEQPHLENDMEDVSLE